MPTARDSRVRTHPRGCLRTHRASGCLERPHGARARVEPCRDLLQRIRERKFQPATVALDRGYDVKPVYEACESAGAYPVIPLRQTPAVKRGEHRAPECEHGTWTFAGSDAKRNATKWRCPSGQCKPASRWAKPDRLHPLIPRETKRWGDLYRGRGAVEREFGRLKHQWGLGPIRVRGLGEGRASRRPLHPGPPRLRARPSAS